METFDCGGIRMTRLWHCFGTHRHAADLDVVTGLLDASGSNVLPLNTHAFTGTPDSLVLGFGGVTYPRLLAARPQVADSVTMLNINLQTSAAAAVRRTREVHAVLPEPVIKLEVLEPDLTTSNDAELVEAVRRLVREEPGLMILPLVSDDPETTRAVVDLGCPAVRVMGSPIGSMRGIADPARFEAVRAAAPAVVLDGGLGDPAEVARAMELGADAVLVNSMLFQRDAPPVAVMRDVVRALESVSAAVR